MAPLGCLNDKKNALFYKVSQYTFTDKYCNVNATRIVHSFFATIFVARRKMIGEGVVNLTEVTISLV